MEPSQIKQTTLWQNNNWTKKGLRAQRVDRTDDECITTTRKLLLNTSSSSWRHLRRKKPIQQTVAFFDKARPRPTHKKITTHDVNIGASPETTTYADKAPTRGAYSNHMLYKNVARIICARSYLYALRLCHHIYTTDNDERSINMKHDRLPIATDK